MAGEWSMHRPFGTYIAQIGKFRFRTWDITEDIQVFNPVAKQKYPCPQVPLGKIRLGMGRVAKRVSTCIINGYLTVHYYMGTDTDLIVSVPTGTHIR